MAKHGSASVREQTPHADHTPKLNLHRPNLNGTTRTATIMNALKRRALAVLNDTSIDAQSRAIIRYGLEINDPWLAELVKRAEAGERVIDTFDFSLNPENHTIDEKVEALAELICQAGETSAAALLVLMGTLENSADPKALVNTAKHFAFTRCGEFNLYGIVDDQIAAVERELWAR